MDKHLHIISLDVPYPADYGGVYDLFYKLPALQANGVKIHLHCFENGRGVQPELNKYCEEVFYYKRNNDYTFFATSLPYIVASRKNETLLQRLLQDDFPILMEGIHCTYPLLDRRFTHRKIFVRIHNVEQHYYRQLYAHSKKISKKIYYLSESKRLKKYEQMIAPKATACWGVTNNDVAFYRNELHCHAINYLPLFLPDWKVESREGKGSYCLYHGNLSVDENEYAAIWLLKNVFNKIKTPLVIAGKNPSKYLERISHKNENTCLISNPTVTQMQDMIAKAHINILPSFSRTGIKLKLLNALYNGRHCLVNNEIVEGLGLEKLCHIAETAETFSQKIAQLFRQPFTTEEAEMRGKILNQQFNNEINAKQIVKWIWGDAE